MDTILIVIILIVMAVVAGMFVVRRFDVKLSLPGKKKTSKAANRPTRSTAANWRSVKICAGLMSCKTAQNMADRIYLAKEAPPLPLENCTEKSCRCKYEFLDDRRCGDDRRDDLGEYGMSFQNYDTNRRDKRGRRLVDKQT